jgi:biotin transport system substrate-specific component
MLRTLPLTQRFTLAQRLLAIVGFTALTALAAQIQIPLQPVPFTMQVLAVLLTGMVLGWRDGMASMALYIGLIAANFPIAAEGMGARALAGPTVGYLIGFIFAAGVTGWLVQFSGQRLWMRWIAGLAGLVVIYAFGIVGLKTTLNLEWSAAWTAGVAPFIALDVVKALIAAGLSEGGRQALKRFAL